MLFAPGAIANERGEEAGEAVGLVRAGRFQVPAERFRSHVDAVDRLRIGADESTLRIDRRVSTPTQLPEQ